MKLKDLLNESQHLSYKRMNVGEEEEKGMTNEEKREFLKAVSEYRKLGEAIYRSSNLAETYESIKNIGETAQKVTLEETGDWFDKVTVNRHMKSMNESFKVFSNTIKEVNTLQQRLESAYDEMGEVLGKYYEIKEGNEFGAERAKAIAAGEEEFEVDGKKYKVTSVDDEDKKNAEEFANESALNERAEPMLSDKEQEVMRKALSKATGVGVDAEVGDVRYHNGNSDFAFDGGGNTMLYVGRDSDGYYVSIEGDGRQIDMAEAGDFKSIMQVAMKMAKKHKNKLTTETTSIKLKSLVEGYSTEEKRIVMMAVKKIAKYMNRPLDVALGYVIGAAQELERSGKVK